MDSSILAGAMVLINTIMDSSLTDYDVVAASNAHSAVVLASSHW